MSDFTLYRGDCLEVMPIIAAGSVDMVMCDLPYGTTACKWDSIIPLPELWCGYERVTQDDAAIVLTAAQPFTSQIVVSQLDSFKYDWTWQKEKGTGHLNAKKQPMRDKEDILVFYRRQPTYNPQMEKGEPYSGAKGRNEKKQTSNYGSYKSEASDNEGTRYPKQIQRFKSVGRGGQHPTQKPVALMEYLIRTYTNEGETVLDNCMGSGTTGVACMQSGRNFIGIELNDYAQAAALRILKAWGGDTMRTIYATPYNDETKQPTSPSTDSGFTTVAEVVEAMGAEWLSCSGRAVVYPGVMFSDYEVAL